MTNLPSAPRPRGKLKIFFGAFPGVGKTEAMLVAGARLKAAGRDVVVGTVQTHGDPGTEALLADFEKLAPRDGPPTGELDLDSALARRPQVILVDELAHANPPGSRHPRRWNDVDELLGQGVDVFTTMSVQNVESLNDVVREITGLPGRETVPDTFFDTAEETIMVDMSADELLARLAEGKVRAPGIDPESARQFFRKGTLLALREIALRRTADVVEGEVRQVRAAQAIEAVWKTRGHLLCAIGPGPEGEHVVRSTARLANQLDIGWTAAYVETPKLQRLAREERARILGVVGLAEELGARTAILTGPTVAEALLEYARSENIATVVLGRGRHRRLPIARPLADAIATQADDLDVIEIGRAPPGARAARPRPNLPRESLDAKAIERRWRYAWTVVISLAVTLAASALHPHLAHANVVMLYLVTVVLVGAKWGRGPAVLAVVLDVAALDYFFVPPRFSFGFSEPQYLLTFGVMLAVGLITGQLAGNLRFQARVAAHREARTRSLYQFARDLVQMQGAAEVIETTEQFMSRQFAARVAVLVPDATGALVSPTARGMTNPFDSTTAQWAYEQSKPAGAGTDTMGSNEYLFLPLRVPTRTLGVLAIRPERSRDLLIPEQRRQFDVFAALVANALERVYYTEVARDALLMARIQSGEAPLALEVRPVADLVEAALMSLEPVLARHPVTVRVPHELAPVRVDPKLIERVLAGLVGNVPRHTPAGTSITVEARASGPFVEVSVTDDGPGVAAGREAEIFESFSRGEAHTARRGAGLGLAISRAIVRAHGGEIRAERGREKGTRFVFTLPIAAPEAP